MTASHTVAHAIVWAACAGVAVAAATGLAAFILHARWRLDQHRRQRRRRGWKGYL